jgi:hypothetical protein
MHEGANYNRSQFLFKTPKILGLKVSDDDDDDDDDVDDDYVVVVVAAVAMLMQHIV